jgi:hypothetical protein
MILLVKNIQILDKFEKDIKLLLKTMVDKIDYRHSTDEIFEVLRNKLLYQNLLVYASINDKYKISGIAIIDIGLDIFDNKSAHIMYGSYSGKCLKEDMRELFSILKSYGIMEISYTTKRNNKAMSRSTGIKDTEYLGSVYKFNI